VRCFQDSEQTALQERANDIADIANQLLASLAGIHSISSKAYRRGVTCPHERYQFLR
jgi:phosphoenolpyruvate-protein kinase (PTS system EI component)